MGARYRAYGWEVIDVDWRRSGDGNAYVEDIDALLAACTQAKENTKPPR